MTTNKYLLLIYFKVSTAKKSEPFQSRFKKSLNATNSKYVPGDKSQ